jgi:UDP-glucose 4-epimerase
MGYIGSHTATVLAEKGHDVILFDNLSNSHESVLGALNKITGKNIIFIKGDVRDTFLLDETFKKHKIDAVIHFAGVKAVGESVENPLKYFDNNVAGSVSLLTAMKKNSIKTIVFSSSATVYGEPH